ncbi:Hint domain-containing protein [Moorena sp. SIO4G3]|uniref:Hint domain-containing protein n=1 Tax=Moorena sp. SIO4G3 TaxID=2607821 RepID=UPI00142C184A|nr:Hint domain-containing protein [Moorena sp. SIO4G3]NEO75179.1 hypothetical protein [Moorena sp. SIO4G3]
MNTIELSTEERDDIKSLIEQLDTRIVPNEPMELDLSNDLHYRFYTKQLEMSGITPGNRPQLYRILEQARKEPLKSAAPRHVEPIASTTDYLKHDILLIDSLYLTKEGIAHGSALASLKNDPYFCSLTLGLYDVNGVLIGQVQTEDQYNSGTDIEVNATGSTSPDAEIKAVATCFHQAQDGTPYLKMTQASTIRGVTKIEHVHPQAQPGQDKIKLCLGRRGADCTYSPHNASGKNVLMPIKGSITYTSDIDPRPSDGRWCLITMVCPDAGDGGGATIRNTEDFFSDPNTKIEGNKISWDLIAKFESVSGVFIPNSSAIYTFTLSVILQSSNQPMFVSITNAPEADYGPTTKQIPPLMVYYSCVAEGTQVTLYDGTTKPIEQIEPGDKVITNLQGKVKEIEGVLKGTEELPMVRLKTNFGHDLLLSQGHPVVTPSGVVLAKSLKVRGEVVTDGGNATITQASQESYGGYVYNLNVGPRQEGNCDDSSTFYANGIIIGDNQMQFKYNRLYKYTSSAVLEALPQEWHEDYANHLKEKGEEYPVSAG